jgi:hypothetical protein
VGDFRGCTVAGRAHGGSCLTQDEERREHFS